MFQTWHIVPMDCGIFMRGTIYCIKTKYVGTLQSQLSEQRPHCALGNVVLTLISPGNDSFCGFGDLGF